MQVVPHPAAAVHDADRRSAMKNVPESLGDSAGDDQFAGPVGYRAGGRREMAGLPGEPPNGSAPAIGSVMDTPLPTQHSRSLGGPDPLGDPAFPDKEWMDIGSAGSLADHPLLRGLLLELPPRGSVPPAGWLDQWFEAARSILELLYVQNAGQPTHR